MSALRQTFSHWFASKQEAAESVLPVRLSGRGSFSATTTPAQVKGFDQPLVWVVMVLLLWGMVMVYSASIAMPDNPRFSNYTHTHFLLRHVDNFVCHFVSLPSLRPCSNQ
jgi:cell division protein FtsW